MQLLKQSTAATTIVGPILDSTGANYTGAAIADLNITKNGTTAAMAAAATLTHDHNGYYLLAFTTGNTDTLGRLDISCNKSTYAMPIKELEVLAAAAFDTIVTNGTLASTTSGRTVVVDAAGLVDANVVKVGPTGAGTAQTAKDIGGAVPAVAAGASGGLLISGSNSGTTTLAALTITGATTHTGNVAMAAGLNITQSSANTSAVVITGNGTGHGAVFTSGSGATGDGIQATAASTNGRGLNATGVGTGAGLLATGGVTGHGASLVGGATSGDGLNSVATTSGHGLTATGVGTTKHGLNATGGSTTSHGISATGGGVGHGILATSGGGATGDGLKAVAASTNGNGFNLAGVGTGAGCLTTGGLTGHGLKLVGGGTSGHGLAATTTSGDGFNLSPTAGHGINLAANGTSKHGLFSTGGTAGTSDGIKGAAGTGGVDIRGNLTGNITGTLDTVTTLTNLPAITAGWLTATGIAADAITAAKVADGAIDRATFAADTGLQSVRSNTAAAGAASTITLDASASATDAFYANDRVYITGGTGVGQDRKIRSYVGSTKVATVAPAWTTNPDNTSTFAVLPDVSPWDEVTADHTASGTTGNSLNAAGSAGDPWSTAIPGAYGAGTAGHRLGNLPDVTAGAAGGLFIAGSNAATTVNFTGNLSGSVGSVTGGVTVTTNNDKTGYSLSVTPPTAAQVATSVWQDTTAGDFTVASSIGKGLFTSGAVPGAAGGLTIAGSNAATTFATLTSTGAFSISGTSNVAQTGDNYNRLGAPAGASVSADVAAVKTDTAAVKVKTDQLVFTVANHVDATASIALGTDTITAASVSAAAAAKIADVTLRRTSANVEASSDGDALSLQSLYGTTRLPLRYTVSGTTLTIYKSDGTSLGTLSLTEVTNDSSANLITGAS